MNTCSVCGDKFTEDQLVRFSGRLVCAGCKAGLVKDMKSGVAVGGGISPQAAAAIQARIKRLNALSFLFALPGLGLQFFGRALQGSRPTEVSMLPLVGAVLLVIGFCIYAQMKGRSWAFGFLGLLSLIGLIILYFLGKCCQNCRKMAGHAARNCGACGAPV